VKLTVLGCAGSYPNAASACSSYLLEAEGFALLVDCGTGSLGRLQARGPIFGVDAVVLSHLHADHCVDMASWAIARRYHPEGQPPPLPVHAPKGAPERIASLYGAVDDDHLHDVYTYSVLEPGKRAIGPFTVTAARVAHPVPCYGLRISAGGRTLAYSADTGRTEALVDLAQDADLFLCEASFVSTSPHPEGVHLTGAEAGDVATRAGAKRLLLTHLVAWFDEAQVVAEAQSTWFGPLDVARAGAVYDV
jgi:ribonuclease BN (tRNA processing enzyme)